MSKSIYSSGISANCIVASEEEFDAYITELFDKLLDRATAQTRRFLRETGQWQNDTVHEKLAQRWAYELLERFMINARGHVPCRPLHLLDSFIFRYYSRPDCLINQPVGPPLRRFLEGLFSRAVHSRDATTAIFYHLYGLGQQEVAKILGLGSVESQRVYKNYLRWRSRGWPSMVEDVGLKDSDISQILEQKRQDPDGFRSEVEHLVYRFQSHYRKSEPAYYPCLGRSEWEDLYDEDSGFDYKGWHIPFCHACFTEVWKIRELGSDGFFSPQVNFQIYPLPKAGVMQSCLVGA